MTDVNCEILYKGNKGADLFKMYQSGNLDAGYWFALLVFEGKFKADPVEGLTKKEQRGMARSDSETAIVLVANSGNYLAMVEVADMYFSGRREPGPFGSVVLSAQYDLSKEWYLKLLEHPSSSAEFISICYFRVGLLSYMVEGEVSQDILKYWADARKTPSVGADFATVKIAEYFYKAKDYIKAIPLLESVYSRLPYSAVLLSVCFERGYGVEINMRKSEELMKFWRENA
jgi:TPR repeat protein